jgi:hypothetical protein
MFGVFGNLKQRSFRRCNVRIYRPAVDAASARVFYRKENIIAMLRTTVQSFFGNHARAIAVVIMASAVCAPGPLWSQTSASWFTNNGNDIWWNSGKVGIGTTSPASMLDINKATVYGIYLDNGGTLKTILGQAFNAYDWTPGSAAGDFVVRSQGSNILFSTDSGATTQMYLKNGGNVGVGTTAPSALLDVQTVTPAQAAYQSQWWSTPNSGYALKLQTVWDARGIYQQFVHRFNSTDYNVLTFFNGYVGIGTTAPQSLLAVNGTITTKEVVVTNTGWSDYVFLPSYHLRPLTEVASFIKEHHHLPEIPSEAEVKEKGVSLGDMQAKLLAKIEELTLHMIQLQARIAQLEAQRTPGDVKTEHPAPNNPNN